MKGKVELILKDKDGNIVHREEKHNMVTNFFNEYFRPLGITRAYPVDYDIPNMVGGILLMENSITESATNIRIPAGNKMVGNGVVGLVNGSGTAVTELGSYVEGETGWQDNGDYKMTFEWTPSQANGTISAICLTSKSTGYMGLGNSSSKKSFYNYSYNDISSGSSAYIPQGNYNSRQVAPFNMPIAVNSGNNNSFRAVDVRGIRAIYGHTNDHASISGKFAFNNYYFPKNSYDFYKGVSSSYVSTPESTSLIDVPSNISSEFVGSLKAGNTGLITYDGANRIMHFVCGNSYVYDDYNHHWNIQALANKSSDAVYCFHYDIDNDTLTADKVRLPSGVMEGLWKTMSADSKLNVALYCDGTTLVVHRYNINSPNNGGSSYDSTKTSCPIFFVDIANGTYTEGEINFNASSSTINPNYIWQYSPNKWYVMLDNYNRTMSVDAVLHKGLPMNGVFDVSYHPGIFDSLDYELGSLTHGYSITANTNEALYYKRNKRYIATIYNLQEAVTKTASLTMQITYTLSFTGE